VAGLLVSLGFTMRVVKGVAEVIRTANLSGSAPSLF
jgi:hypothetical protein